MNKKSDETVDERIAKILQAVTETLIAHYNRKLVLLGELDGEDLAKKKVEKMRDNLEKAKDVLAKSREIKKRKKELERISAKSRGRRGVSEQRFVSRNRTIRSSGGAVLARIQELDDETRIYRSGDGKEICRVNRNGTFVGGGRRISGDDVGLLVVGLEMKRKNQRI